MKQILLILALAASSSISQAQNIETLWRARGLEAVDLVKSLKQKADKKQITQAELCKLQLEAFYTTYANPEVVNTVITKKGESTSVILFLMTEQRKSAQVSFHYSAGSPKPDTIYAKDFELPWVFAISNDFPKGSFMLLNDHCSYLYLPNDYFHPNIKIVP